MIVTTPPWPRARPSPLVRASLRARRSSAPTSQVDDDQLRDCRSRGMDAEEAVALVVNGFCKDVLQALPMEFAMEAQALVAISLEGSVG